MFNCFFYFFNCVDVGLYKDLMYTYDDYGHF